MYLRLDNGLIAVYGHLSRFIAPLESLVEARQDSLCQYEIEMFFEPWEFRFGPGDTIAFSGDTGSGPPHLHFEIRSDYQATFRINPLDGMLDLSEARRPKLTAIALKPLEPLSSIGGHYQTMVLDADQLNDTLIVSGSFGLEVEAHDTSRCGRVIGAYSYLVTVDGQRFWDLRFDRFPSSKSYLVDGIYDVIEGRRFTRLYCEPDLDFEGCMYGPSILKPGEFDFLPGFHTMVIRVTDAWGNADSVVVPMVSAVIPRFDHFRLEVDDGGVAIDVKPQGTDSLGIAWCEVGAAAETDWRAVVGGLVSGESGRIHLEAASAIEVRCRLIGRGGIERSCVLSTCPIDEQDTCSITLHLRQGWLEVIATSTVPPLEVPKVTFSGCFRETTLDFEPLGSGRFRATLIPCPADTLVVARATFRYVNTWLTCSDTLRLLPIVPGKVAWFRHGGLALAIAQSVRSEQVRFVSVSLDSSQSYTGFEGKGLMIDFEPDALLFPTRIRISLRLEQSQGDHLGVFALRGSHPAFLARLDSRDFSQFDVSKLDDLVILEDREPPSITWDGRIAIRGSDGKGVFRARVSDRGSGIEVSSLKASVDGKCAIVAYDPDTRAITVRTTKPLPNGGHRIRLEARDRIGNQTAFERIIDTGG